MKRFILIAALCLAFPSRLFATLVQSTDGGTASFSGSTSTPYTITTSAVGFSGNTIANDLLVWIGWLQVSATGGTLGGCGFYPSTSGFSWTQLSTQIGNDGSGNYFEISAFYIANAGVMGTGTHTTGSISTAPCTGAGITVTSASAEFSLYEFNNIVTSSPLNAHSYTSNLTSNLTAPGSASTLSTSAGTTVIVAYSAKAGQSNVSAGSGYNLGINATVAVPGQAQYTLNVPSGSGIVTSFGGTLNYWEAVAVAFKQITMPSSSGVPRHKGSVF